MSRLALINTNRMQPPIAPIGLDYLIGAVRGAGVDVDLVDLCLSDDPDGELDRYLSSHSPRLVGLSFRNVDDCFFPRGDWFVPSLVELVRRVRGLCDAPIVLGGVGYSIFPESLVAESGADFGVKGDGEGPLLSLLAEVEGSQRFDRVEGLVWREDGEIRSNPPCWPGAFSTNVRRDGIDNVAYFRLGGQAGIETKRGCYRRCAYCADPLAKGRTARLRPPSQVAEEVGNLIAQGVDVFHLSDSEFNLPPDHAFAVCEELARRGLGARIRWYAYLAVTPLDDKLAEAMARAGCAGINFTGDSASALMLESYGQPHRREDLASAVRLCRRHGIAAMIDLLFGGPGETPETAASTVEFVRKIDPDRAGAAVGIRLYPGTPLLERLGGEARLETEASLRRRYSGPVDLLRPTFYVSRELGERPCGLVRELIGPDRRFFAPDPDPGETEADGPADSSHNYNDNERLVESIAAGARGAYWDILRRLEDVGHSEEAGG